ncbi:dTDP-4-dehydrorhamnose reductase [Neiella sp. HB171785]|uniref:dTDP-4-dehydrorhamnose reductase n=1 Tax=Neiella litorisoli TaxID=2771431 RepID=A0A8J6R317_9GAMM|nr:dTDP-4-dehydrorhamnose reductase [Neiella litorisoli]
MKVLVTGKGGQLAWELARTQPEHMELVELGIEQLDITNAQAVEEALKLHRPQYVINAAAYTAVDKAESDAEQAYLVNETGAENLSHACLKVDARLLHVSTDFVFAGDKVRPYQPEDEPRPINVYGASKLAGDEAVSKIMKGHALIVRTAWVYSANGSNFVKTMLHLMSERPQLGVIYDQIGTPTWARGLALWLWQVIDQKWNFDSTPIFHWTDAGVASWYDFAIAIQELAIEKGLLKMPVPIAPIATSAYPTPAARPAFSVIDKTSAESFAELSTVHWRQQLSRMLDELAEL